MRYKTLLDYDRRDKLLDEAKQYLTEGLWLVDLDPRAEQILLGPFDSVSDAHDARDYIWHYGDKFGRYIWHITHKNCQQIRNTLAIMDGPMAPNRPHVELDIDTLPLEVTGVRLISGKNSVKFPKPRTRKTTP